MEESVEAATPIVARSYALPGESAWVREQLDTDFVSLRELLRLIWDEPTNSDLKETARFLSRHMVDRADALLGWLQDNG
jgi:hypothetical protein